MCQDLDVHVQTFSNRRLEFSCYPYVFLDAECYLRRDPTRKQLISRAEIVAVGISANGQREMLGIEVGGS